MIEKGHIIVRVPAATQTQGWTHKIIPKPLSISHIKLFPFFQFWLTSNFGHFSINEVKIICSTSNDNRKDCVLLP